ncbi:hypothetical protein WAI453_004003 [Rhynchosporium graminicola]
MLLHGRTGTGKTLTAEREFGTQPEEVEKYLESVLYFGKTWRCVIALEEVDIFTVGHSISDLQRTALVSVLLRALDHYYGIFILTCGVHNRFSNIFMPHIHLSIQYQGLGETQR